MELVHLSNFKLRNRDTGEILRYPDSPVFLAEKNTKVEQFAISVAQSGSMSTLSSSSLSEHEAAWHVMRSGDGRENLGFGRYDMHAYQIKHDVDVIRFERLEDMLKWLVDAVKSLEGIPPFDKVTRSTKTSSWKRDLRL